MQANITNSGHTLTLPAAVNVNNVGIQGLSGNVITFALPGVYEFEFETNNGGGNISIFDLNRAQNYYYNPVFLAVPELFSATGNISLTRTTTVITANTDPLLANLNAGSEGQIKVIAYGNSTGEGNCLITVADAAWNGAGVANISANGAAATFQYINGNWFCIGNNSVTFS